MSKIVEVSVPQSLEDITVEQFRKFNRLDFDDEDSLQFRTLEIFCGVPYTVAVKMPQKDIEAIMAHLSKVLSEEPKDLQVFEHNGKKFGRIPNLEEITGGEFIDLDNYSKPTADGKLNLEEAHKMLAVMYRPVTATANGMYAIEDYEGSDRYSEVMRNVSLSAYKSAIGFFLRLKLDLLTASRMYLQAHQEELNAVAGGRNSVQSGVGTVQSITSLTEMLQGSLPSQVNGYYPFSRLSNLKRKRKR